MDNDIYNLILIKNDFKHVTKTSVPCATTAIATTAIQGYGRIYVHSWLPIDITNIIVKYYYINANRIHLFPHAKHSCSFVVLNKPLCNINQIEIYSFQFKHPKNIDSNQSISFEFGILNTKLYKAEPDWAYDDSRRRKRYSKGSLSTTTNAYDTICKAMDKKFCHAIDNAYKDGGFLVFEDVRLNQTWTNQKLFDISATNLIIEELKSQLQSISNNDDAHADCNNINYNIIGLKNENDDDMDEHNINNGTSLNKDYSIDFGIKKAVTVRVQFNPSYWTQNKNEKKLNDFSFAANRKLTEMAKSKNGIKRCFNIDIDMNEIDCEKDFALIVIPSRYYNEYLKIILDNDFFLNENELIITVWNKNENEITKQDILNSMYYCPKGLIGRCIISNGKQMISKTKQEGVNDDGYDHETQYVLNDFWHIFVEYYSQFRVVHSNILWYAGSDPWKDVEIVVTHNTNDVKFDHPQFS